MESEKTGARERLNVETSPEANERISQTEKGNTQRERQKQTDTQLAPSLPGETEDRRKRRNDATTSNRRRNMKRQRQKSEKEKRTRACCRVFGGALKRTDGVERLSAGEDSLGHARTQ